MKDGLVPAQGRIPNFGDSLEAVTLGAVSGAASTLLGVGLAGPARPDVRGRGRRRGWASPSVAFLPLSGEVPPTLGEGPAGLERVRKSVRERAGLGRASAGRGQGRGGTHLAALCRACGGRPGASLGGGRIDRPR